MDSYSSLLLEMYRAARTLPADQFPDAVMAMLRVAVDFDSARLLSASFASGTLVVQGAVLYNIPPHNVQDWEDIHRNDLMVERLMAAPGKALPFHSPTLFAEPKRSIMRDYANRYEHQNGLAMLLHDSEDHTADGLSFYRARDDAYFGRREQCLMQSLMPHLQETLKLNRQLAAPPATAPAQGALLIAQTDGIVQYCGPHSQQLMHAEWPAWRAAQLPAPLLDALNKPGSSGYAGKHIVISYSRVNTILFLRMKSPSPLTRLSPREFQVAALYGKGLQAKAIAAQLGIAPATARNLLQSIYQKLEVHDKAALAGMFVQRPF